MELLERSLLPHNHEWANRARSADRKAGRLGLCLLWGSQAIHLACGYNVCGCPTSSGRYYKTQDVQNSGGVLCRWNHERQVISAARFRARGHDLLYQLMGYHICCETCQLEKYDHRDGFLSLCFASLIDVTEFRADVMNLWS